MELAKVILALIISAILAGGFFFFEHLILEAKATKIINGIDSINGVHNIYKEKFGSYKGFDASYYNGAQIVEEYMEKSEWEHLPKSGIYKCIQLNDYTRFYIQPTANYTSLYIQIFLKKSNLSDGDIAYINSMVSATKQQIE